MSENDEMKWMIIMMVLSGVLKNQEWIERGEK